MPGKPPAAVVSLVDTSVSLTWQAPATHFAVIDQYEILFLTADGEYVENLDYCDGTENILINSLSCAVPMLVVADMTALDTDTLI